MLGPLLGAAAAAAAAAATAAAAAPSTDGPFRLNHDGRRRRVTRRHAEIAVASAIATATPSPITAPFGPAAAPLPGPAGIVTWEHVPAGARTGMGVGITIPGMLICMPPGGAAPGIMHG